MKRNELREYFERIIKKEIPLTKENKSLRIIMALNLGILCYALGLLYLLMVILWG